MTALSVNINKVATLRNARGGNVPDVLQFALDCEAFGADGVTVHPRPDERHIRRTDVYDIAKAIHVEFNIEGYPSEDFIRLVTDVRPAQVTLVPDSPDQLTSNHGWDTVANEAKLRDITARLHQAGCRVSIFVDPTPEMVEGAKKVGADRVELYTGPYAELFQSNPQAALEMYRPAAEKAHEIGLGLNAGHDLSLQNLRPLIQAFPWIDEVSIGHQIIADALYLGIKETIKQYKAQL
ncbi:MAG: pyridoxine 5'-phosphate synthase [Paludibacteraceae bacterium]|nr:pyridoxine 5'-phosphate synthase [Paludibacteraceae bacterium]